MPSILSAMTPGTRATIAPRDADEAPPPTAPPPSPPPSPPAAASQGSSVPIKVLAAASLLLLAAVLYNSMGGWQSQAHTMGLKRPAAWRCHASQRWRPGALRAWRWMPRTRRLAHATTTDPPSTRAALTAMTLH